MAGGRKDDCKQEWDELMMELERPSANSSRSRTKDGPGSHHHVSRTRSGKRMTKRCQGKCRYETRFEFILCPLLRSVFCSKDPRCSNGSIKMIAKKLASLESKVNQMESNCKDKDKTEPRKMSVIEERQPSYVPRSPTPSPTPSPEITPPSSPVTSAPATPPEPSTPQTVKEPMQRQHSAISNDSSLSYEYKEVHMKNDMTEKEKRARDRFYDELRDMDVHTGSSEGKRDSLTQTGHFSVKGTPKSTSTRRSTLLGDSFRLREDSANKVRPDYQRITQYQSNEGPSFVDKRPEIESSTSSTNLTYFSRKEFLGSHRLDGPSDGRVLSKGFLYDRFQQPSDTSVRPGFGSNYTKPVCFNVPPSSSCSSESVLFRIVGMMRSKSVPLIQTKPPNKT